MIVVCETSWNLRLQTNFHGIKYINLIFIYLLLSYNNSISDIEHTPNYIALGSPQTTKWFSDNQHCYNIYIYIYIYIYTYEWALKNKIYSLELVTVSFPQFELGQLIQIFQFLALTKTLTENEL